jgi:hypothetical protein
LGLTIFDWFFNQQSTINNPKTAGLPGLGNPAFLLYRQRGDVWGIIGLSRNLKKEHPYFEGIPNLRIPQELQETR